MVNMQSWSNVKGEAKASGLSKKPITPGGHICVIKSAMENPHVDNDGVQRTSCIVLFDIKEGSEYDGVMDYNYHVAQSYAKGKDVRYPGRFSRTIYEDDGFTVTPAFKGFIECVCESNPGFMFGGDVTMLRGKKVGLVFRNEEYQPKDSDKVFTLCNPYYPCPVSKVKDEPIPAAKPLKKAKKTAAETMNQGMTVLPGEDEETPF